MDIFNKKLVKSLRAELEDLVFKNPLSKKIKHLECEIETYKADINKLLNPITSKGLKSRSFQYKYSNSPLLDLTGEIVKLESKKCDFVRARHLGWIQLNLLDVYHRDILRERDYAYRIFERGVFASPIQKINRDDSGNIVSYTFDRGDTVVAQYVFKTKKELIDSL
jgi:hypothetical protein